jgi:hypothetical protein
MGRLFLLIRNIFAGPYARRPRLAPPCLHQAARIDDLICLLWQLIARPDLFDPVAAHEHGAIGDFTAAFVHGDEHHGIADEQGFFHGRVQAEDDAAAQFECHV